MEVESVDDNTTDEAAELRSSFITCAREHWYWWQLDTYTKTVNDYLMLNQIQNQQENTGHNEIFGIKR